MASGSIKKISYETSSREWTLQARCRGIADPESFFKDSKNQFPTDSKYILKNICAPCPVRHECLKFAIDNNEQFGIWGGMTAKQRNELVNKTGQFRRDSVGGES